MKKRPTDAGLSAAEGGPGVLQDCEFTYLSTQILHVLGDEGPKTKDPSRYIRFIYNRIILENATVRAAAVSSLAKFGALSEDLRDRVKVLLSRALHDNDDEVRRSGHPYPGFADPVGLARSSMRHVDGIRPAPSLAS